MAGNGRDVYIGTDSTGAEYWLTPFTEKHAGHRKFVIRNSKKHVPDALIGMFTNADIAKRAYDSWQDSLKKKKDDSRAKSEATE